jgi:outer membrane protein assembly factor BamB
LTLHYGKFFIVNISIEVITKFLERKKLKTKIRKGKTFSAIAFALMLSAVMLIACLPIAAAQTKKADAAFLSINPKTVGLGQYVLINAWVSPMPPLAPDSSNGVPRTGYYYDIYKPDGTKITHGPDTSDGPGTDWFVFTPDQVGTWKVSFRWAGDADFQAVSTPNSTFVVQSTIVPGWPGTPLPDGPWTRPISAANREWYVLGGTWMSATGRDFPCFNPYSLAPESAHILWSIQTRMGGIIGGNMGDTAYQSGGPGGVVIMMGRAYYSTTDGLHCVDVHTGEQLWTTPVSGLSGTLFALPGPTPYLWTISTTAFRRYNAETGALTKTVTGMPTGANVSQQLSQNTWRHNRVWMSEEGIVYFNVDDRFETFGGLAAYDTKVASTDYWAGVLWNIERVNTNKTEVRLYDYPSGWPGVIVKNYSLPLRIDLSNYGMDFEKRIIFESSNGGTAAAAFNMDTGELLWWHEPVSNTLIIEGQNAVIDGVGMAASTDTMRVYGYDLATGNLKWTSEPNDYPWGGFRAYSTGAAYGKGYFLSYDGTVRAYYATNGSTAWIFRNPTDTWGETPYGQWAFYQAPAIADGKVYAVTNEHSPTQPLKRGERLYCIDDKTGTKIWSIMGCNSYIAIADGVLVASDTYAPMLYGFDKGETVTTVQAAPKVVAKGTSVIIEGTVMDLSPAQPNTPAVSENSMTGWMEYLHMGQPKPTNTAGVPVLLFVKDPSGVTTNIGTATSDATGFFSYMWKPTAEGKYTITATFAGSKGYYSSTDETAVGVDPAAVAPSVSASPTAPPTPTPTQVAPTPAPATPTSAPSTSAEVTPTPVPTQAPPPTQAPSMDIYVIAATVVIIVVIAVVALVLRRRSK